MLRIAFVAATSWFTCSSKGGAEKQIYHLATALAKNGHHVDMYTMDIDKPFFKDGVNVIPAWNRMVGIRFVRYFTHRMPSLVQKLRSGKYDLVYMRGYSEFSQKVVRTLRHSKTRSVIGIASDKNLSWKLWKQSFSERNKLKDPLNWLKQYLFKISTLKYASIVVTQNKYQTQAAMRYNMKVICIPSIYIPNIATNTVNEINGDVAWIGGLRPEKGVNTLLTVIDALPKISFIVVGNAERQIQKDYAQELIARPNVTYIKNIDNSHIHALFSGVKVLLNTSPHEGFSNTFLEAWYAGKIVVSMAANPSGLLSDGRLGWCAEGNLDNLIRTIQKLINNESALKVYDKKARDYVIQHHGEKRIVVMYEKLAKETEILR